MSYYVWRSSTSPVPINMGHLVTSGITETNYTDCENVNNGSSAWPNCRVV